MKKVIFALATLGIAASCSSVSDKTTLQGTFSGEGVPEEIRVQIPEVIDTVVKLENAAFKLEIPACKAAVGQVIAGNARGLFVSDGTVLTFTLADGRLSVSSSKPAASVTERPNAFDSKVGEMMADYRSKMKEIQDSASLSAAEIDSLQEDFANSFESAYNAFNMNTINENKDNALSVYALRNVYYNLEDDSLEIVCNSLDTAVAAKNAFVGKMLESVAARKATAEGKPFTDFTVAQPDGSEAKLSDYVGKGKYVLVDFWASWCRPCKMEIPNIKAVYDEYKGKDFDVLSVAIWDQPQASIDTAKVYNVNWNEIVNGQSVPSDIYGIQSIPHIILFGPDGTIVKRNLRGEAIAEEVARYVKK
jgi:thiol-disulfide isomerase/thioredoxin